MESNVAANSGTFSWGGGLYVVGSGAGINSDVIISNCIVRSNAVAVGNYIYGGGLCVNLVRTLIYGCIIENNYARDGGAAIISVGSSTAKQITIIENSVIRSNVISSVGANFGGNAIYSYSGSSLIMRNCLVYNNFGGPRGGAIYHLDEGTPYNFPITNFIENCTIVSNTASSGGAIYEQDVSNRIWVIVNSIITSNYAGGNLNNFYLLSGVNNVIIISNSCVNPTNAIGGKVEVTNSITNSPMFVSYTGQDFHLERGSACIDSGMILDWHSGASDLDGSRRVDVISGKPDMGCYEYTPPITLITVE